MSNVIVSVSVVPVGTESTGLGDYIREVVKKAKASTVVKAEVNSMSTVLEGEMSDVMDIVKQMHETPFEKGVSRVVTDIRIDDRRDKRETIDRKVARALGEE